MPTVFLPDDPSREHLRNEARALQRSVRAGDPDAVALAGRLYPSFSPTLSPGFRLSAAQLVVARRYGLASWPKLMAHLDVIDRYRRDPSATVPSADPLDDFCRLACLSYQDDDPAHRVRARELLARHPDLPGRSIHAATTASDVAAVRRFLGADPDLARREGGPYRWEPLCYLAYSRLDPSVPAEDVLAVARLLLDAGADPNAGYLWRGLTTPFTLLTGAFGEGEDGPVRQPRHPHWLALARLLLDAGADPNDGQTLYNRMFRPDDDHLELLFAYGLGRPPGGPWVARLGGALESPAEMLARQVWWAVGHGFAARLAVLAAHSVDVRSPVRGGRTPIEVAAANGDTASVAVLAAAGVPRPELAGLDAFVAACLAGDRATVDRLREADPGVLEAARRRHPDLVARAGDAGRREAIALLAELGFEVSVGSGDATPLHWAAWNGDLDLVRRLVAAGADTRVPDGRFDATPLGWAEHAGYTEIAAYLEGR